MLFEGHGFIDVYAKVLDAAARGYWLVVDNEGWVVGEVFSPVFAKSGQAVEEF
jgi:hypothetical protein